MKVLGLTGGIASGKSTTAKMFAERGVPVFDADACVHALYREEAVAPIAEVFPFALKGGEIDRAALGDHLVKNPQDLAALNALVHPLVAQKREAFIAKHRAEGAKLVLLDIPLLFEIKAEQGFDAVVVAWVSEETQRSRALARPGMTEDKLGLILAKQMPLDEKRKRADFVIDTGQGLDHARQEVAKIIAQVCGGS